MAEYLTRFIYQFFDEIGYSKMDEYIKKSDLKTRINKILYDIENFLIESEAEKTKIGYETGYKDGVNQTFQAIKCHLQNSIMELDNVQR